MPNVCSVLMMKVGYNSFPKFRKKNPRKILTFSPKVNKIFWIPLLTIALLMHILPLLTNKVRLYEVYGVLPTLMIKVSSLPERDSSAVCYGLFTLVDEYYFDNETTIRHELAHVKQLYRTLFVDVFLVQLSDKYLLDNEIEAFVVADIKHKNQLHYYAEELKELYVVNSDISVEYIETRLKSCWDKFHSA